MNVGITKIIFISGDEPLSWTRWIQEYSRIFMIFKIKLVYRTISVTHRNNIPLFLDCYTHIYKEGNNKHHDTLLFSHLVQCNQSQFVNSVLLQCYLWILKIIKFISVCKLRGSHCTVQLKYFWYPFYRILFGTYDTATQKPRLLGSDVQESSESKFS